MKKRLLIPLVVFLAVTGVGIVATYWPRPVPWDECSELYRRYADSPDIRAAYIKDYQLSDTLTICATILEAANDSSWSLLIHDFNVRVLPIDSAQLKDGLDVIACIQGNNCEILTDNELAVLSLRDKYICIFHNLEDLKRSGFYDAILDKIMNSLLNHKTFIKNEEDT